MNANRFRKTLWISKYFHSILTRKVHNISVCWTILKYSLWWHYFLCNTHSTEEIKFSAVVSLKDSYISVLYFSVDIQTQIEKWDDVSFHGDRSSKVHPSAERTSSSSRAPSKEILWYNFLLSLQKYFQPSFLTSQKCLLDNKSYH